MSEQPTCDKCGKYMFQNGEVEGALESVWYHPKLDCFVISYLHEGRWYYEYEKTTVTTKDNDFVIAIMGVLDFMDTVN